MSKPNRYSPPKSHRNYGIDKWFSTKGLHNHIERQEIINKFCEQNGFENWQKKYQNRNLKWKQSLFISNNFLKFTKFVLQTDNKDINETEKPLRKRIPKKTSNSNAENLTEVSTEVS